MANWHTFKALNQFFLFDVLSNSLFLTEEAVFNYFHNLPISTMALQQVEYDLAELKAQGLLQEQPENEYGLMREPHLKALCLHVSHDCNLRCRYCFAGTGPFGGAREHMSFEVAQKAIDLLLQQSKDNQPLEVDFFGGEPLLNFEVVKQTVEYGKSAARQLGKILHFTLTTNGKKLDQTKRNYLNQEQIALVLSLDGRPDINDHMRGKGSYQSVLPNLLAVVHEQNHQNYYLRGTFTSHNLDFTRDVEHLYNLGFRELSVEPVVDLDGEYQLNESHLMAIENEYDQLMNFYLQKKRLGEAFTFFHFEISLEHGPCLPKRLTGCGAGFNYLAVTPSGEFYPCHQFVGRTAFLMGDVNNGITNDNLRREFGMATLYKKEGCKDCWSRFYCGGGCHANAHLLNGSIYKPDPMGCSLQRKRLECALALKGIELI